MAAKAAAPYARESIVGFTGAAGNPVPGLLANWKKEANMLCCVGLIGGAAVGQALGGPWTVIAPAAGFGIGLIADMKFMKGMHGQGHRPHADSGSTKEVEPDRRLPADTRTPVQRPLTHAGES